MYLSLDSSGTDCSVALLEQEQEWFIKECIPRQHSQKMLPMLEQCLQQANRPLSDITHFCYVRGPGSFTGVRIAASFIHGLALAKDKPVLGISSLLTMAYEAYCENPQQSLFLVALDARMSEVYFSAVDFSQADWAKQLQEQVVAPENVQWEARYQNAQLVGNGWQYLPRFAAEFQQLPLLDTAQQPDARFVGRLLQYCQQSGINIDTEAFPVYLRDNVTWDNKPAVGS